MRNKLILLACLECCLLTGRVCAQEPGDTVIVVQDAEIRVGTKVLQRIGRGIGLQVQDVNGDWLWVSHESTGWIHKQQVVTPNRAIEVFTEQLKQSPRDSGVYFARGVAWHRRGEQDIAIKDFNEAIRLDPKNFLAWGGRGRCWDVKGLYARAIADYSEAIRRDPTAAMILNNRAVAWIATGEFDKAQADATEAIRLQPRFAYAFSNRGAARVAKQEYDSAISDFDVALEINPKNAPDLVRRGQALSRAGKYARAAADFSKMIAVAPESVDGWNQLAWLSATCSDADFRNGRKALECAVQAFGLTGGNDAGCLDTLAAAFAESGDFDNAVTWQTKALAAARDADQAGFQSRLDLYKSKTPYRDESRK